MVRAIDLALAQAEGKAGKFTVKHESRDDSTEDAGAFTAAAVAKNATDAARDERAAGYIGDFNSGATAISIPILSGAGIAQISPASTAVGLTTDGPSADPGEPDTYYYKGVRNFARIVPHDGIQAAALVTLMDEDGCDDLAMISDGSVYGRRLARDMREAAKQGGLSLTFDETIGTRQRRLPALAATRPASCFLYSGGTTDRAVRIFTAMASACPRHGSTAPTDSASEPSPTDAGAVSPKLSPGARS